MVIGASLSHTPFQPTLPPSLSLSISPSESLQTECCISPLIPFTHRQPSVNQAQNQTQVGATGVFHWMKTEATDYHATCTQLSTRRMLSNFDQMCSTVYLTNNCPRKSECCQRSSNLWTSWSCREVSQNLITVFLEECRGPSISPRHGLLL